MNIIAKKISDAVERLNQIEPVFRLGDQQYWTHYRLALEALNNLVDVLDGPTRTTAEGLLDELRPKVEEVLVKYGEYPHSRAPSQSLRAIHCLAHLKTLRHPLSAVGFQTFQERTLLEDFLAVHHTVTILERKNRES